MNSLNKLAAVLVTFLACSVADAAVISYRFVATIDLLLEIDPVTGNASEVAETSFLGTPIKQGYLLDGVLRVDTSTPPYAPTVGGSDWRRTFYTTSDNDALAYRIIETGHKFEFGRGPNHFSGSKFVTDSLPSPDGYAYDSFHLNYFKSNEYMSTRSLMALEKLDGSLLSDTNIPVHLDASMFDQMFFQSEHQRLSDNAQLDIASRILSFERIEVPEPGAILLLATGGAAMIAMRRRKRRHAPR